MELESKFIEGTNNQYSIRNDGVVIQHFKYHRSGKFLFKERELKKFKNGSCTLTINKISFSFSVRQNLKKYFNIKYCTDCKSLIEYRDNSHQCEECKVKNKEVNRLSKAYIARIMRMKVEEVDNKLYEAAKTKITIFRKLKQLQNGKERTHS